ncbi:MAG: hypothetical protein ACLFTR_02985, partial [Candidatus Woesearchaeota archaeon]
MASRLAMIDFYGHLNEMRDIFFPTFPSYSVAQLYGHLDMIGREYQNLSLMKNILKNPELFRFFFEEENDDENKEEIFTNLYNTLRLKEYDVVTITYNHVKRNSQLDSFVRFIKRRDSKKKIILICFYGLIEFDEHMFTENVIHSVVFGSNVPITFTKLLELIETGENLVEMPGLKYYDESKDKLICTAAESDYNIFPVSFKKEDIDMKRVYHHNLVDSQQPDFKAMPDLQGEISLHCPIKSGCTNGCFYCTYCLTGTETKKLGNTVQ